MKRNSMVRYGVAALLGLGASAAFATQWGTVVSSTPVMAQTAVPQQQCYDEQQTYATPPSGAGALLGAVIGGVVGHSVGAGFGRAAATGVGVVAGAAIGDRVEANGTPALTGTVRRCQTVSQYQNQIVGYDVVYDYAGTRYSARMAQDPGSRVPVDVNVSPSGAVAPQQAYAVPPAPTVYAQPAYAQPVYVTPAPVYVAPAPAIYVGGGWGWGGGRHWH